MVRNQLLRSACSESAGFRARYQGSVGLPEYSVLGFRERGRRGRRAKRLQDKFGSRWNMKTTVTVSAGQNGSPATATDDEIYGVANRTGAGPTRRPRRGRSVKVIRTGAVPGGADQAGERSTAVDIPRYRFGRSGEFERDWHLALWAPNDPDGPTVIVNIESPVLEEIVKHHQSDYPDVFAEEVGKTVRQVFGEVATCKNRSLPKARQEGARRSTRPRVSQRAGTDDCLDGPDGRREPDRTAVGKARPQEGCD